VPLDQAAVLNWESLRSLDPIHLAAAQAVGDGLAEVITYDRRTADAAHHIGLPVIAPV
jgi:predicted nucleic acid-binding protein